QGVQAAGAAGGGGRPGCGAGRGGAAVEFRPCAATRPVMSSEFPERQPSTPLTAAELEWARQEVDREEFLAGVRRIEETGGLRTADFTQQLGQVLAAVLRDHVIDPGDLQPNCRCSRRASNSASSGIGPAPALWIERRQSSPLVADDQDAVHGVTLRPASLRS